MNTDVFNQVFGMISQQTASGAQSTGQIADFLIRAGLSAAAITQILNGVANSAAASPAQIDYVQNEMRYLNDYYAQQQQNSWVVPALLLGGLFLLTRD